MQFVRLWALSTFLLPAFGYSQSLVPPEKLPAAVRMLQNAPSVNSLGCEVNINKNPKNRLLFS